MPKTIVTLRNPENPNLPGEVREFNHVGAIMGGQTNALLTFHNEDPIQEDRHGNQFGGPKPFFAIASSLVYSVETPEFNREPKEAVNLVVPAHLARQ